MLKTKRSGRVNLQAESLKQSVREKTSENPSPVIILLGETGGGKSNFIALAGKPNLDPSPTVGDEGNINSCTKSVEAFEVKNSKLNNGGTYIQLIDTPGFDASDLQSDSEILRVIIEWLRKEPGTRVAGILCLQNIQSLRLKNSLGGIGIQKILGLPGVSLVTTHWSSHSEEEGNLKERQLIESLKLKDPKNILCRRFDYNNGKDSAWNIIRDVVKSPPDETRGTLAERLQKLSGISTPEKVTFTSKLKSRM